ncbi:HEAT repeat domain-containing protein [Anaeromyxobacter paludicola]|uniref:HEAT repeat domain-containing protein n=1 Tax=Anaeromyxobacter paludicola TaxID=2918171 RepID=A0ABM7X584_9BACT|nr:HEAT repeat domain-containing protein [Anaeromyxobacter paludicola]BDG06949.1 hypothetical protein AMPC_00620 [Anaeromyxobacter paludicola]
MTRARRLAAGCAVLLGAAALILATRWWPGRSAPVPPSALPPAAAAERLRTEQDFPTRRELVRAIAKAPDAVPRLEAVWRGAGDGAAREEALIQVSKVGGADGARFLAEVASTDPRYGARAAAALGQMKSAKAADELARIAESDAPAITRANAAQALGRTGDPGRADELVKLAADPGQPLRVRQESALGLARVGGEGQAAALSAALEAAASDGSLDGEQLRIPMIQALGHIGTPQARAALAAHAQRELSRNERAFLLLALGAR